MDTPIYIDTYFRVESGYDGGRMPEEKAGRFFDEVKRLFTETGFSIKVTVTAVPPIVIFTLLSLDRP